MATAARAPGIGFGSSSAAAAALCGAPGFGPATVRTLLPV
ncbi:hypothetical protein SBI_05362 [Streptomyces bingchenggensis BCW-1]|uniref:Uncharacterized protein n=1 Tax=Streptomyces bingchenggensis (strain BCW-1) TaxID=749414 RepID=D7C8T1_STRBB|nr:hypothetical protein SBI_05362 [Streptomyces bingchenggensis BCW-1]